MAVGRISGPLLKSNLIRNGIDLAFETDLLYLDVNNQRIGVKKSTPEHELDVNGTTQTVDLIVLNRADIADVTIENNTISTLQPYLNLATLDTVVSLNKLRIDSIDIEGNAITTNESNANLELRPNGTGSVDIHSNLNVDGNVYVTGNITADGTINLGDADTDNVVFNAEVSSDIIPDITNTYSLGSDPSTGGKEWNDVWANNLVASSINSNALDVGGIDLTLRQGNIWYVAENGDDANSGDHVQDPFASVKYALSQATSGDTVWIYPGTYTEEFPLTVPAGVTVSGQGIRSVFIQPSTATRYNDAFLLNGETTLSNLTVGNFYSGGNYFEVTAASAGSTTVNVGTAPFAHTYVSGGTINIGGTDYAVTGATYTHTTGVLVVTHSASVTATPGNDIFLSNLTFSCNSDTRVFPDNGYAFRFATDFEVTSRSPYIKNTTVITAGSTTTAEDPRGFNAGDAGKGAYIDGAYATANSKEASMLFHSATFITPGVDAITATNGARIEWLNGFTYFANRSIYAYDSNDGLAGDGKTRIKLSGITGTAPAAGQTVTFTSTDSSTVIGPLNIESVENSDTLIVDGKDTDLIGFDTTPASIDFSGGGSATTIENLDIMDFGAEIRLIGSASVYGNYGLVGDGPGVLMYAIGHNLAYIGNGKEVTNDPGTVIQDNEVVETNDAKIRYTSVDHKGDFRVGDLFYVNQEDGTVDFAVTNFTINASAGVTFVTGGDTTFIDGTKIETGDWRISGNTIETLTQDANFNAASGEINLNGNVNVDGNLDVTGNVTIGGNITIGDEATDTIQIVAGIDSDVLPSLDSTYSLGTTTKRWSNLWINQVNVDDIEIRDNYIQTTQSNSDLELRASGTGEILVPSNDVVIQQDLDVVGTTTLGDTVISGAFTLTGSMTQTGSYSLTGDATIGQNLTVGAAAQFEEILIDDNYITTTSTNADLELRASGTGEILVPTNDVRIVNDLAIGGSVDVNNATVTGTVTSDRFRTGDIVIDDNYITTTLSNSDLELRANGTGEILVPSNNVQLDNDLTVSSYTDLQGTSITGTLLHNGNVTQTGNIALTGNYTISGTVDINSAAQLENILIDDNVITTTQTNSDLELRASGTGEVLIPNNDVVITNDLRVDGTFSVGDINSAGTITANRFSTGDILIDDNFITTTLSNSDLELRANGTGDIIVPENDVVFDQDLTVNGNTTLSNTTIVGTITHTGNTTQTGNVNLTGYLNVNGPVTISSATQYEDIRIDGNVITTTLSNSDFEIRANGSGIVLIPDNDVEITNNLTVDGVLTVGDVVSTGTIQANNFTTGDILIDDNFITTTTSNSDLELRANGTGSIIIDNFDINNSTISSSSDITLSPGSENVIIDGTGGLKLPVGDTSQRPTPATGQIRFNSELGRFEGYNGSNWIQISGVIDLDGDTKVTAELTEGANDNTIRFDVAGNTVADIDATRLNVQRITVDEIVIDDNVISTATTNSDIVLDAQGTGSVKIDAFAIKDNTITNTVTNSVTTFNNTANGYVKFDGTYGMVLPVGGNAERPPVIYTEVGMTRFNTDLSRVEVWDGSNWVSVAGSSSGITRAEAEDIAFEIVLSLG